MADSGVNPHMPALRITELRSLAELEDLRRHWQALAQAAPHDTPYVLPEFLLPWIRRLGPLVECCFLAAWQGPTLVGLAPVVRRQVRRLGIVVLTVRGFPEAAPTPPCDLLVRPGHDGVVAAFLAHWLKQGDWDALEFQTVPVESAACTLLADLARQAGLRVTSRPALQTYTVPVQGSWQDFHATRTQKTRQNLRRGLNYLRRAGSTRYASFPGELTLADAQAHLATVLANSWKDHEQGGSGWNAFLRDLIDELNRADRLRLTFLLVGDSAVAYLMDVPFKNAWYAIHNAYDLRVQAGNAGQLMMAHAIEDAHHRQALRYDFTGDKDYLRRWSKSTRQFLHLRIARDRFWTRLRLHLYDHLHGRRERQLAAATDSDKDARKDAFRGRTPVVGAAERSATTRRGSDP